LIESDNDRLIKLVKLMQPIVGHGAISRIGMEKASGERCVDLVEEFQKLETDAIAGGQELIATRMGQLFHEAFGTAAVNYYVFLTANGNSNGLYVARKTAAGLEIREHGGESSNVAFDYRIVARRRGYEAIRMLQVPERKILETMRPPLKMTAGQPKIEPVKIMPRIVPAEAIRSVPPRPR
jgi:hypothetical protein